MIISHKYQYLFVELPHTASTAISEELCENYHGISILRRNAYYHEFLRIANAQEKIYLVFSCIRNPLDQAVSLYYRLRTNHKGTYNNSKSLRKNAGDVTNTDMKKFDYIRKTDSDFSTYFKKFYDLKYFYRFPYDNPSRLSHRAFGFIMRFENLQNDFTKVLKLIGVEQKRPLPLANKTSEKRDDCLSCYTPEIYDQAKRVFGPFMKRWGYDFPPEWGDTTLPWLTQAHFHILGSIRYFYWRYLNYDSIYMKYFEHILP